ncbi:MAG TPA: RiPP maturation radical SAM protein 1, partial [Thermoplasmatales archaeon]|nr:RiPP maturation radical SAM protein 1 [Thermoplasmatales archaeon]
MAMHDDAKTVLLLAMPFAGTTIPAIQLPLLEGYLKERGIAVSTRHLYLKAAEFYGLPHYNFLISSPNDSYTAQMVFAKYVFPEHWHQNLEKFRTHFNQMTQSNPVIQESFTFDEYVHRTDQFYHWVIKDSMWQSYDLIGFTLNYGQFLPSLAIAKKIKELDPTKKIVFGGSRTVGTLGIKTLKAFEYVDFIVSGEGEEALYQLAKASEHEYTSVPRLQYRKGKEIRWNHTDTVVDLNQLPIPSYDPFYAELSVTSLQVQQYFQLYGRLPIEISRGCWWNKCTFCNLNIQHEKYREKNVDRIIEELQVLSDAYNMLAFQLIGNTLPRKDCRKLLDRIIELGKDFSFFVEARAGQLTREDYQMLKKAGFTIMQTGIETFSSNYIKKMNKGVRVIDNIAALKFCKENGIINRYNLIINYPNEETRDFTETQKTVQLIQSYLDPPQLSPLFIGYGSTIYRHPEKFNIATLEYTPIDKLMFPKEILEQGLSFFYQFTRKQDMGKNNWEQLVAEWQREQKKHFTLNSQTVIDDLVFYFLDGGTFLKIYDKRSHDQVRIYVLDELERAIFLACQDVI